MNLLVIINSLNLGGAERLVYDQLRFGAKRWHVSIVCLENVGQYVDTLKACNIQVTELGLRCRWDWTAIARLRQLYKQLQPDIVHLHLPRSGVIGRLASIGMPHKVVYTEHNTWDCYSRLTRFLNMVTYHLNDEVIAVSDAVADFVRNQQKRMMRNCQLHVIPNGIDIASVRATALSRAEARRQLGLRDEDFVVGNVANLYYRKGHQYLINAASLVCRVVPQAQFVIIGSGDEERALRSLAHQLNVYNNIVFTGQIRDAYRMMPAFDIYCHPSLYEGMSLAIIEAMTLGLPVIATPVGGTRDIVVDSYTGYLVPIKNSYAIAFAILRLFAHVSDRQILGIKAQNFVTQQFTINRLVDEYDEVYKRIL